MVNGGEKLPKMSFQEVTGESTITAENYAKVVEVLFDTSDIDVWLTDTDGTPMTQEAKDKYRANTLKVKGRWLAKYNDFIKTGKQTVITEWFTRFNAFTKQAIHESREEFRRGLIATASIANYPSLSPESQKNLAGITTTQTGELILRDHKIITCTFKSCSV